MSPGLVRLLAPPEIDPATAERFAGELFEIDADAVVHLDCSEVRFIDSTGVKVLVEESQRRRSIGGGLVVENPTHLVRKMLEVAEVADLIQDSSGRAD